MTRINLITPQKLCNQHLLAEWREIPRVITLACKNPNAKIPTEFTLGTGHVTFFYNKLIWVQRRHTHLTQELLKRGYNLINTAPLDLSNAPLHYKNNWLPTLTDIQKSIDRINTKMPKNPKWRL